MASNNTSATRLATRLAFIIGGFAMACWAPLVPYAKANVGVDDAGLGLLLLCLGVGSVLAMPFTGVLAAKIGSKPLIIGGAIGLLMCLPLLVTAQSALFLAPLLVVFGASMGTLDVAMNIHAVEVERDSETPLMSGFHAMFSIGGFFGAGAVTLLLATGTSPNLAALYASIAIAIVLALTVPRLLKTQGGEAMVLAFPKGIVLFLAFLSAVIFLAEGSVLDWGALLIQERGLTSPEQAGLGYMAFAAAMTIARLTGDRTVSRFGGKAILIWGGWTMVAGILLLMLMPIKPLALFGFVLIGLGAANIVPILFSAAGRQKSMPPALAIAAVTTIGYAGILVGPAALGFVAESFSLVAAFGVVAALAAIGPLTAGIAVKSRD